MSTVWAFFTHPATRKWLYAISFAITSLLGVYGTMDGQQIAAWNFLVSAVLGVAAFNTDTKKPSGKHVKVEHDVL